MNTHTGLDPQFRNAVSNLVIDDHSAADLAVPLHLEPVIRQGLEQVLTDPDSMFLYLKYLDSLKVRYPFKHRDLLDEPLQEQVVQRGLECLTPRGLAVLALNPFQLLDLRDRLAEDDPSDHWWPIIRRHNREARVVAEAFDEYAQDLETVLRGEAHVEHGSALAGAYFGERSAEEETPREAEHRDLWTGTLPLEDDSVEWLEVADSERQELDSTKTVEIEFAWYPERPAGGLEVRLSAPLLLTNRVVCVAWLQDAHGARLGEAKMVGPKLCFTITEEQLAGASRLEFDYTHPDRYRLRFHVPLKQSPDH